MSRSYSAWVWHESSQQHYSYVLDENGTVLDYIWSRGEPPVQTSQTTAEPPTYSSSPYSSTFGHHSLASTAASESTVDYKAQKTRSGTYKISNEEERWIPAAEWRGPRIQNPKSQEQPTLGHISQIRAAISNDTAEEERSLERSDDVEDTPDQTYFRESLGTVAKAVADCAEAFRQSCTNLNGSESKKHELGNQRARFNIWRTASAFVTSTEGVANDALLMMLGRLCSTVLALGEKTVVEDITASRSTRTSTSSSSSSFQVDSETAIACGNFERSQEEAEHPYLADVEANISLLFRYTDFVQTINTAQENRRSKQNVPGNDDDTLPAFEASLRAQLEQTCPVLVYSEPPDLLKQIVRVTIENRKRLIYYMERKGTNGAKGMISAPVVEAAIGPIGWVDHEFPPVPSPNQNGDFECIYCPRIFQGVLESAIEFIHWRWHILGHARPYICLFPDCYALSSAFDSTAEWVLHMKTDHGSLFWCQSPDHKGAFFNTAGELGLHLELEHSDIAPPIVRSVLAERSRHSVKCIFATLIAIWNANNMDRDDIEICSLCGARLSDLEGCSSEIRRQILDLRLDTSNCSLAELPTKAVTWIVEHIAKHLVSIALWSLPTKSDVNSTSELGLDTLPTHRTSSGPGLTHAPTDNTPSEWIWSADHGNHYRWRRREHVGIEYQWNVMASTSEGSRCVYESLIPSKETGFTIATLGKVGHADVQELRSTIGSRLHSSNSRSVSQPSEVRAGLHKSSYDSLSQYSYNVQSHQTPRGAESSVINYGSMKDNKEISAHFLPQDVRNAVGGDKPRRFIQTRSDYKDVETLDPRYRRVTSSHRAYFFVPGRVFKMLWSEPAGLANPGKTRGSTHFSVAVFGDQAYSEIRRFVVVSNRGTFSQCLPIQTYRGQGSTKLGLRTQDHGQIYTGGEPPPLLDREVLHKQPIQVHNCIGELLKAASRINYGKAYAIEHNVKVLEIGMVAQAQIHLLQAYFTETMQNI